MKNIKLKIRTKSKNYNIFIGNNIIKKTSSIFKSEKIKFNKCLIVADSKVPKSKLTNLKNKINCNKKIIYFLNANEKNKNQKTVDIVLNILLKENFNRNDAIISLGGGITGDIVGFAASIYKRGINFVNMPSTLLAQVDASIGGKTGINNKFGKNLIGSFYQPSLVISDTSLLKSLTKREIICGYAEILKHSIISGLNKFMFLEKNKFKILNLKSPYIEKAILESCKVKKNVVEKDEKENSYRKVLNLGHTFAHAFESTLKYSNKLNHGEAVILGIVCAVKFSSQKNILSKIQSNKIIKHVKSLNLKINIDKYFKRTDVEKIVNFMKTDKKNSSSKINLILLKNIGKVLINNNYDAKKIALFFKKNLFK